MWDTYYFNTHLRWNLLWDSPNHAGAVLASASPFLWALAVQYRRGSPSLKYYTAAAWILIAVVVYALLKTYSRGSFVAFGCALAVFTCAGTWPSRRVSVAREFLAICCVTVVFSVLLGSSTRLTDIHPGADMSIAHRLSVWKHSIEMIVQAPYSGWGFTPSFKTLYGDWFQPAGEREVFGTPVSGVLLIVIQLGVPATALIFGILVHMFGVYWIIANKSETDALSFAAAVASIVSYITANVFTTVWVYPSTLAPFILAIAIVVRRAAYNLINFQVLRLSAGASGVVLIILLSLIHFAGSRAEWRLSKYSGGVHMVRRNAAPAYASSETLIVLTDPDVCGYFPGQVVRQLRTVLPTRISDIYVDIESIPPGSRATRGVDASEFRSASTAETSSIPQTSILTIVAFGHAVSTVCKWSVPPNTRIVVVNPLGAPEFRSRQPSYWVLPGVDETGTNNLWREACERSGGVLRYSTGGVSVLGDLPSTIKIVTTCLDAQH